MKRKYKNDFWQKFLETSLIWTKPLVEILYSFLEKSLNTSSSKNYNPTWVDSELQL